MQISTKHTSPVNQKSACLVVGVMERRKLSPSAQALDQASGGYLAKLLKQGDMDGKAGQSLMLFDVAGIAARRVLLVGCGKPAELNDRQFRKVVETTWNRLGDAPVKEAVLYLGELAVKGRSHAEVMRMQTEQLLLCEYRYQHKQDDKDGKKPSLNRLVLDVDDRRHLRKAELAVQIASAIAKGANIARELGNLPGNICTPAYLADSARDNARGNRNTSVKVLRQKDIEKLKMGAFLSVAKGSREEPRLIVVEYKGGKKDERPHVLVGKGITFDAGGISIKPSAAMDEMKFDMCGAAGVLGTMVSIAELKLPINVVAVVPSCENLPDGQANKPGDVVTSMSGQTIEILNTDAEGRLILCDALTYSERFKPKTVIDVATLTGACVVALGKHACGLLSNDEKLADHLLKAGRKSGDRAWQLPLWEEYDEQLKSNFADMANIGGRDAGTITAACFLARFTEKMKWAHLDIAGVAWHSGHNKGATGRPVALLTQYLMDQCGRKYQLS